MRLQLLLVLVFGLASCCYSAINTDTTELISSDSDNVKRYLKGNERIVIEEERGFPGVTTVKQLIQKIPGVSPLKTLVKENPTLAKANMFVSKRPKLKAATLIIKGQVKPLLIIGAVALTGGYFMYLVKG